jgi:DNA-binding HxlR family transcriptional regulator
MRDDIPSARAWALPSGSAQPEDCPLAETLAVIGGKHKPRILHCLLTQEQHFLELTRALTPISRKVLTEQLAELQAAGLIARTPKQDARRRVSYRLTAGGQSLTEILSQIHDWALQQRSAASHH